MEVLSLAMEVLSPSSFFLCSGARASELGCICFCSVYTNSISFLDVQSTTSLKNEIDSFGLLALLVQDVLLSL
uniref:Uncharacterized protein n=1 Tax=Fagus sylvatica TaxID=28930 RepID=A0A2N9FLR7_FAGSY